MRFPWGRITERLDRLHCHRAAAWVFQRGVEAKARSGGLLPIRAAFGHGCQACDHTGHVCADDGITNTHPPGELHPWDGLSTRADACDHGGGAPCPRCSPRETHPPMTRTRDGVWSLNEGGRR